jgi:hypothetical protein
VCEGYAVSVRSAWGSVMVPGLGFGALLSMVMVLNCAPFNLDSGVCREVLDTSMLFDSVLYSARA